MNNKPAFTLIEILVASTIIIVLMSIGVASFRVATQSSRDAKRKADMESVRQALVLRRSATGNYGTSANYSALSNVTNGIGNYLSGPLPQDPGGSTAYAGVANTSSFCFCADLERGTGGNANVSGAITAACTGTVAFVNATGGFYCVDQP